MKKSMIAALLAVSCLPSVAEAGSAVYAGCSPPAPAKPGRHIFWVDPAKGSKDGDGSAAKPWRTLSEVLGSSLIDTQTHNWRTFPKGDTKLYSNDTPNGPIKPGDVLMLKSGDHGAITIFNLYNPDYITIMAAPNETPVFDRLSLVSSGKWAFRGIKIQGLAPTTDRRNDGIINVGYADWVGTTTDIILDGNNIVSSDDTSKWSPTDWMNKPLNYAIFAAQGTSCIAMTNNWIHNAINGVAAMSNNSVVQGNTIEYFSNDGIDLTASNLLIKGNVIRHAVADANASSFHADGIQGFSMTGANGLITNTNVVIDSNTILKTGDATKSYLQGISIFDGLWDGLTISNNVVVSNVYHGIALYGGANATIINNTVLASSPAYGTWIIIHRAGDGSPAKNVTVRNNIAPILNISSPGVTLDHNIVTGSVVIANPNGTLTDVSSGSYGNSNKVAPGVKNDFVTVNNSTETYDLRLKAGSAAYNFGSLDKAPLVDIIGRLRKPTVTAGAYN